MSKEEELASAVKLYWGDNAVEYLCAVISTLVTPEQMTVLLSHNKEGVSK